MQPDNITPNAVTQPTTSSGKNWVYIMLAVLIACSLGYYALVSQKDRFANHDYYRVLYEATNRFNENLNKLERMHQYKESDTSIRSLLPSYTRKKYSTSNYSNSDRKVKSADLHYVISGQKLTYHTPQFQAELDIADILPIPKKGFSQYLFADENGQVVATVGDEKTISIVELSSINQQIEKTAQQFKLNFAKDEAKQQITSPLPSYSRHVDMDLSYGSFRIYVFPFSLATPLKSQDQQLNRLYLVGLLPQHQLISSGTGYWNVTLLMVSMVSLIFMWSMLRLFLLPKNQSITPLFRKFCLISGHLFFIVILAWMLSYIHFQALRDTKDNEAYRYVQSVTAAFHNDLDRVFSRLSQYRSFYQTVLQSIDVAENIAESKGDDDKAKDYASADDAFTQKINDSLKTLLPFTCQSQHIEQGLMPQYAATQRRVYRIEHQCPSNGNAGMVSIPHLDQLAQSTLLKAFTLNQDEQETLDFYSGNQQVKLEPMESIETFVEKDIQHVPQTMLTIFALNREGNSTLPSIYFQESNALPETFNLSHRDYYKMVRDQKGWNLTIPVTGNVRKEGASQTNNQQSSVVSKYKNVFIQRLLNVNNGTRGTTISMPIYDNDSAGSQHSVHASYILGADVFLPSMSLAPPPPFDFSMMLVNRQTGDVLFHNDTERSLVENLYHTGNSQSKLSQWLKAGLDQSSHTQGKPINGYYHGQAGRFSVNRTAVDHWVLVVFSPNDSLEAFMTNQFLYIAVTFSVLLVLIGLFIAAIRGVIHTPVLKQYLKLPSRCTTRVVMILLSVAISVIFCLYHFGQLIELYSATDSTSWSSILPLVGTPLLIFIIYIISTRCFLQNTIVLISFLAIVLIIHQVYLSNSGNSSLVNLAAHYQQIECNWLHHERNELNNLGLSRYPNSIIHKRRNPLSLLPADKIWLERLANEKFSCSGFATKIRPQDYPTLSSLVGATYMWQWINQYILTPDKSLELHALKLSTLELPLGRWFSYFLCLLAVILGWFLFNVKILWGRLYCSQRFLQYVERMTNMPKVCRQPKEENYPLTIVCDTTRFNGIGLALLLRSSTYSAATQTADSLDKLLPGFNQLYNLSPCLQKFSEEKSYLPNLKLNIRQKEQNGKMEVELWDIETCLEKSEFRSLLLELIMELKSLTLSGQITKFTLFTGFHSLQRVKIKDALTQDFKAKLEHIEYLAWAECLMDFAVEVPTHLQEGLDISLLNEELRCFPELQSLTSSTNKDIPSPKSMWKIEDESKKDSRWATINYILLHAEALYRFKWESCSNAEKLALYNLAKKQRLNPTNRQMIEHLALNGLIKVKHGHLEIINQSFEYFVLHAETPETLNQLVMKGEAGVWKSYRLPLGILIVLIIGGIALTSGESIYVIAASMAGVLGTIASVTNSASFLRGGSRGESDG